MATTFRSILYLDARAEAEEAPADTLTDLNLDQSIAEITAGKEEYDLQPFFRTPLDEEDAILYRQEVMRDLDDEPLAAATSQRRGVRVCNEESCDRSRFLVPPV